MTYTCIINKSAKSKKISNLCKRLVESAGQTVSFFQSKLQTDGSYGSDVKDIACYFKSPMMFLTANKPELASLVLRYIQTTFMSIEGDFKTDNVLKSINEAYIEYWSYINGWIVRAANKLDIKDISHPGYEYLLRYNLGKNMGFLTNQMNNENKMTDVLTVAHHGLINLEMENLDIAVSAGNYLCKAINIQPNLKEGFYLRLDKEGNLLTHFPKEKRSFYFVSATEENQLYFMIGYPSAYLAKLYEKIKDETYLKAAKAYLEFSLSCDESVYQCDFSHKIAWAASIIYKCTHDTRYLLAIEKITDHFIAKQKNGMWFAENINNSYDQSAEIACWFLEIEKNIS